MWGNLDFEAWLAKFIIVYGKLDDAIYLKKEHSLFLLTIVITRSILPTLNLQHCYVTL